MKWHALGLILLALILTACNSATYGTAEFRDRAYNLGTLAISEDGLTAEQIRVLTSTKPPSDFPVDVALIVMKNHYLDDEVEHLLVSGLVNGVKACSQIGRITPIPRFLVPGTLGYPAIQELGIRTLSEYVLVLSINPDVFFKSTKIIESKYKISSAVDVLLLDAQTTAILTADRLYSFKIYTDNILGTDEEEAAKIELFSLQGKLLGEKLAELFNRAGQGSKVTGMGLDAKSNGLPST
jgi:hypothetical protein